MIDDPRDHEPAEFEWRDQELWEDTRAKIEESLKAVLVDKGDIDNLHSLSEAYLPENSHTICFKELSEVVFDLCGDLIRLVDELPYANLTVNISKDGTEDNATDYFEINTDELVAHLNICGVPKNLRQKLFGRRESDAVC